MSDQGLLEAVKQRDINKIHSLLSQGYKEHLNDAFRYLTTQGSPVDSRDNEIIRLLIKSGADVHVDNDYALMTAIDNDDLKRVVMLILAGININAENDRTTPLKSTRFLKHNQITEVLLAASRYKPEELLREVGNGDLDIVSVILYAHKQSIAPQDLNELFSLASRRGDVNMANLLIQAGADPNAVNFPPKSLDLVDATDKNDLHKVRQLILEGANVNIMGGLPLKNAVSNYKDNDDNVKIVRILMLMGAVPTKHMIETTARKDLISLLKRGITPNDVLISAIYEKDIDMIRFLLALGVDIHDSQDQALRLAVDLILFDIVVLLVEEGANIHADNDYAINKARQYNYIDIVNYLQSLPSDGSYLEPKLFDAMRSGNVNLTYRYAVSGMKLHLSKLTKLGITNQAIKDIVNQQLRLQLDRDNQKLLEAINRQDVEAIKDLFSKGLLVDYNYLVQHGVIVNSQEILDLINERIRTQVPS
jgi:ankyrin repeat protein